MQPAAYRHPHTCVPQGIQTTPARHLDAETIWAVKTTNPEPHPIPEVLGRLGIGRARRWALGEAQGWSVGWGETVYLHLRNHRGFLQVVSEGPDGLVKWLD